MAIQPPAGDYFSNSAAVVTATPAPGWTFLQWLGDATGTNPVVSLGMSRNKTVRAAFGTTLNTMVVGGGSLVVNPEMLDQDGFRVTLTGEFGARYAILGTTNLLDWTEVGTITNTYGATQLTDPAGTNLLHRIYRAISE